MADKIVTVDIQSNLKEETVQAKEYNKELAKAQSKKPATRTGSRAADAALGTSERGLTRGTSGTGGRGEERDFARQAQGLGGLVRVYATFAANIYAVTAAFNALSKAAGTTNMVRAAQTLSASYGISLSNVSKELRAITDGAISASEALGFATLGGAAGLTTKQMSELATVGKSASIALGRDLTDSLQRVYRGAIKIEPELLDELGIMVKIDDAVKAYSRTLNKSVTQLTDFERRQAFVNAVIDQGNTKFGEVAAQSANPYSKLLAAIQDVSKDGLTLVNTVLTPIVDLLSKSPTALIAVATLIIGSLAKLAIPSLVTNVEQRLNSVSEVLGKSSEKLQQANKAVIKSFEGTAGFKFISADTNSKLVGNAKKIREKLNESLYKDLEESGTGPIKLSIDTENLINQYESALLKAQKNVETTLKRGDLSPEAVADLTGRKEALTEELAIVGSIQQGYESLADDERIAAQVRSQQNRDTLTVMRDENKLSVLLLLEQNKYGAAIAQAFILEKAITAEKNKQVTAIGLAGIAQKALNNTTGFFLGSLKAAQAGLIGLVSKLPAIGAAVAIGASALASIQEGLKYFGLLSDISDENIKKFDTLEETIKTLTKSFETLSKATNINQLFELKTANLTLLIQARQELTAIEEGFAKFEKSATFLDKLWDSIKEGIIGLDSQLEVLTRSRSITLAVQAEEAGGLQNIGIRRQLERETKQRDPAPFSRRVETLTDAELIERNLNTYKNADERAKRSAELQTKINKRTIEEDKAVLANRQDLTSSQLELTKITKDYTNSLVAQVPVIKAQRELLAGLAGSSTGFESLAKYISGFTNELATLTGAELDPALVSLRDKIAEINAQKPAAGSTPEELKTFEEGKQKQIKTALEQAKAEGLVAAQINKTIKSTLELVTASAKSELAIANLNRRLRQISTVESVLGGKTTATETARQRAQAAIADAQDASLRKQLKTLQLFEKATVETTRADLGRTGVSVQSTSSIGLLEELVKLQSDGSTRSEAQNELIYKAIQALGQYVPGIVQTQGALAVSQAGRPSALENNLNLLNASAEAAKRARDTELKNLTTQADATKLVASVLSDVSSDLATVIAVSQARATSDIALKQAENTKADVAAEQRKFSQVIVDAGGQFTPDLQKRGAELEQNRIAAEETLKALRNQIALSEKLNPLKLEEVELNTKAQEINSTLELQQSIIADITVSLTDKLAAQNAIIEAQRAETANTVQLIKLEKSKLEIVKEAIDPTDTKALAVLNAQTAQKTLDIKVLERKEAEKILVLEREARTLSMRSAEERAQLDDTYFTNLAKVTAEYAAQKTRDVGSIGEKFGKSMVDGIDATIDKFGELAQKGELSFKSIADFARNTFSDVLRDIASDIMKNVFRQLVTGATSSSGGGGILGTLVSTVGGALLGSLGGFSAPKWETSSTGLNILSTDAKMANGGIMSQYGPVQLQKYASGGIADRPQLALFGEGSRNEAYVPLPDNRSIPVTLSGNSGGVVMGDTNISISIDSSGNAETSVEDSTEYGRIIGLAVKRAVNEEFIKQSRPGGIIYNK